MNPSMTTNESEPKKLNNAERSKRIERASRLAQHLIIQVVGTENLDLPGDYAKAVQELVRMLLDGDLYATKGDHLAIQQLFLNDIKASLNPQPRILM